MTRKSSRAVWFLQHNSISWMKLPQAGIWVFKWLVQDYTWKKMMASKGLYMYVYIYIIIRPQVNRILKYTAHQGASDQIPVEPETHWSVLFISRWSDLYLGHITTIFTVSKYSLQWRDNLFISFQCDFSSSNIPNQKIINVMWKRADFIRTWKHIFYSYVQH